MKDSIVMTRCISFTLSEKQKTEIELRLREIFEVKKSFIQPQYSLSDLSNETGFSRNLLSAFFNQTLGFHFNNYINLLRITYCKHLILNGYASQFTLEGLSKKCGFYNRNTFISAFKKFTGVNPSYYLKQHILINKHMLVNN